MKSFVLKQSATYPEVMGYFDSNSLGDQVIIVIKEDILGHKKLLYAETNPEGSHKSVLELTMRVREKGFL